MMNTKLALFVSVSAYALQMNPVYASLLSSPPASILDTNTHTSAAGCGKLAAEGLCPEARCSEILLSQAHCRSQTCHNVQSSAPARQVAESKLLVDWGLNALLGNVPNESIFNEQTQKTRGVAESGLLVDGNFQNQSSTVILGLDPRIQVKQGFLNHLDNSDLAVVSTASAVSQQQVSLRLLAKNNVGCFLLRPSVRHWHDNSAEMLRHEAKASAQHDKSFLAADMMPSNAFMPLATHSQLAPAGAPRQLASVCFITDTGACSGNSFGGGANTEDGGHGAPGGSGDNSGNEPDYTLDNYERCAKEGYTQTACSSVQQPSNRCPYNKDIFEKCVCKPNLQTCSVPYYGVGEACGGKYASCQRDDDKACKAAGYSSTTSCPAEQTPNKVCPYNASYHDKCVCHSDLKTCTKPEYGVGNACGGKYLSCQKDDAKACKEDSYTQSAACSSTQQKDGLCPYNNSYYKQCVCKPEYKYACTGTGYTGGSGSSCDGKYSKCSCSASYEWTGSVCTYVNPCAGYYECGGTWQYCTGRKCSSDSTKCSTYCVNDYFPNKCSSSSACNGIYRNGYCSGSCSSSSSDGSSGGDSGGDSSGSSGGSSGGTRVVYCCGGCPNSSICFAAYPDYSCSSKTNSECSFQYCVDNNRGDSQVWDYYLCP